MTFTKTVTWSEIQTALFRFEVESLLSFSYGYNYYTKCLDMEQYFMQPNFVILCLTLLTNSIYLGGRSQITDFCYIVSFVSFCCHVCTNLAWFDYVTDSCYGLDAEPSHEGQVFRFEFSFLSLRLVVYQGKKSESALLFIHISFISYNSKHYTNWISKFFYDFIIKCFSFWSRQK